jgi:hypothetical protein
VIAVIFKALSVDDIQSYNSRHWSRREYNIGCWKSSDVEKEAAKLGLLDQALEIMIGHEMGANVVEVDGLGVGEADDDVNGRLDVDRITFDVRGRYQLLTRQ